MDDYLASLWHYDLEKTALGMRPKEDLEKLFYTQDFPFVKGAYQAGELCYMANFSERLILGFRKQMENMEEKELSEAKQFLEVLENRRRLLMQDLAVWANRLDTVFYYKSLTTHKPFVDFTGLTYCFTEATAMEKAQESMKDRKEDRFVLESLPKEDYAELLYKNGMDKVLFNEGGILFHADRIELFARPYENDSEQAKTNPTYMAQENRHLRLLILMFLETQALYEKKEEGEDKKHLQKALQNLEAQMAPYFMQAQCFFKVQKAADDKVNFFVLTDSTHRINALAAYNVLPDEALTEDQGGYMYQKMPFFGVAHSSLDDGQNRLDGMVMDPGDLDFFLNKDWLRRLDNFAKYVVQKVQEEENKKGKEKDK